MIAVDSESVVLLDDAGEPIGSARKEAIHGSNTPLHLAFSCYLFNPEGQVLITRRSLAKRSWPGVWTNSFCGHPAPHEAMADAIRRHAITELGVPVTEPSLVLGDFRYRAVDASGIVENELCPVYTATTLDPISAEPSEVAEWAWVEVDDLIRTATSTPAVLSPWCVRQVAELADVLREARP